MTQHAGVNILEVWDWRLSIGAPMLFNKGKTWVVKIMANDGSGVLDEHDTGVKTTGNNFDYVAIAACYDWLRTVRDKYSRDHIELRKPVAAMINYANATASAIEDEAERNHYITKANAEIKKVTAVFHNAVNKIGKIPDEAVEGGAS